MRAMVKYALEEFKKIIDNYFPNLYFEENTEKIKGELNFHARYEESIDKGGIREWNIVPCFQNEESLENCIQDVYLIEIDFDTKDKINKFPIVIETGGRIKNLAQSLYKRPNDLHLNNDGTCCLGIFSPSDCLSLHDFLIKIIYPYFFWQAYFNKYKIIPPCGEYPHPYAEAIDLRIIEEKNKLNSLHQSKAGNPTGENRNTQCPCGSGIKYKKCCLYSDQKIYSEMIKIKENLLYFQEEKNKHRCIK